MSLSTFRSSPAATAAKLGAKLVAAGSELWHCSLRYKLFMLNREKATSSYKGSGQKYYGHVPLVFLVYILSLFTFSDTSVSGEAVVQTYLRAL